MWWQSCTVKGEQSNGGVVILKTHTVWYETEKQLQPGWRFHSCCPSEIQQAAANHNRFNLNSGVTAVGRGWILSSFTNNVALTADSEKKWTQGNDTIRAQDQIPTSHFQNWMFVMEDEAGNILLQSNTRNTDDVHTGQRGRFETHLPSWGSPCTGEAGRAEAASLDWLLLPQVLMNPAEIRKHRRPVRGEECVCVSVFPLQPIKIQIHISSVQKVSSSNHS